LGEGGWVGLLGRHPLQPLFSVPTTTRAHPPKPSKGRQWLEVTDGQGSEALLPFLLEAAPFAGADTAPIAAATEETLRDKNQAIDALDKVRALVRERLGDLPLLSQGPAVRRRRRHRSQALLRSRVGGLASAAAKPGDDADSMISSATHAAPGLLMRQPSAARTSVSGMCGGARPGQLQPQPSMTGRSSLVSLSLAGMGQKSLVMSQPDHVKLPEEYLKVIELLREREEKPSMCLALNEVSLVGVYGFGPRQTTLCIARHLHCLLLIMRSFSHRHHNCRNTNHTHSLVMCMRILECGTRRPQPGRTRLTHCWGPTR